MHVDEEYGEEYYEEGDEEEEAADTSKNLIAINAKKSKWISYPGKINLSRESLSFPKRCQP